jgi:hypothetical protein
MSFVGSYWPVRGRNFRLTPRRVFWLQFLNSCTFIAWPPLRFTENRIIAGRRPERYASVSAPITFPRKLPTPYGSETSMLALRPKKFSECEKLIIETLNLAVAPVIGTVPSNVMLPSKNAYVKVTALV